MHRRGEGIAWALREDLMRGRSPSHGGTVCQESMVSWPGDLLCVAGVGREDCLLAFLAAAGLVPPCGRGSSWSARSGSAVRARARTNELDAGERRPMIGGGESLPVVVAGC